MQGRESPFGSKFQSFIAFLILPRIFSPTMSTPAPTPAAPPPPSANATAPKPKKAPLPPLELTEEEMAVVNKWTSAYEKTIASKDQLRMLSEQILPCLTPLNRHLSEDAWRIRKSVSMFIYGNIEELFNKIAASKTLVSEYFPLTQRPHLVVADTQSFSEASCLPHLQERNCSHCIKKSKWCKAGYSAIYADFSSCGK